MAKGQTTHRSTTKDHALAQIRSHQKRGGRVRDGPRKVKLSKKRGGGFAWAYTFFR